MAISGDFSSLFQLGVGVGVGLSLFRAPVDLRVSRISKIVATELVALRGVNSAFSKKKRRDLSDLNYRISKCQRLLDSRVLPFMIAAIVAALLNLMGLIFVTLRPDVVLGCWLTSAFLFISVGWFLVVLAALEIVARKSLGTISCELERIRATKAEPIAVPDTAAG